MSEDINDILFVREEYEFDSSIPRSKLLWNYFTTSYGQFMDGQDTYDELELELKKEISTSGAIGQLKKLETEKRHLAETRAVLEDGESPLEAAISNRKQLTLDVDKMKAYCAEVDAHERKMATKRVAVEQELEELVATMDVKERELARKREIFATQEFSPSDVERIKRNRQELQQHIDLLRNDTQELEKQICENEMKISKQQEKCSASILEYNRIAHMQKLVPSTAENACGLDIELKTTTHWHKPDVFANIKPSLTELRKTWRESVHDMNEKVARTTEIHEQVEDMLTEKKDSVSKLQTKVQRLDKDIQSKKESSAAEVAQLEKQVEEARLFKENSEREMKRFEGRVAEAAKKLSDAKTLCAQKERQRQGESAAVRNKLTNVVESLIKHKETIQAKSAEMLAVVTDDVEREKTKCREAGITLTEDTTTTSSTQAENKPTHPPADTATPTDTTASRTNEETDVVNRN